MLLGERIRDCAGRDEAEIDEHLPERRAAPVLLGEGVQQLDLRQEALVDHDLTELSPRLSGAASTNTLIGRNLKGLKSPGALAGERPEHEGEPVHADHVGLDPEHEHGGERGAEPGLAPEHAPHEATFQATNASMPSSPSSTPSSM